MPPPFTPSSPSSHYAPDRGATGLLHPQNAWTMPSAAPISERPLPRSSSSRLTRLVVAALQLVVVSSMVAYAFGHLVYFNPFYASTIRPRISEWWNVPVGPRRDPNAARGHPEMIRPTFFTLFASLPLLVGAIAVLVLQQFRVRRWSSQWVMRVLRRKPSSVGELSFWSYGEWLFFLLLVGGNIALFYWTAGPRLRAVNENARRRNEDVPHEVYLEIVGVTMGFNSVYNMAFLFLPATRNALWMEFFNLSYANGIKYHRWVGVAAVFTAAFHGVCFTLAWLREGVWVKKALPCFSCPVDSLEGFESWRNVFGELTLACFLAIGITSLPIIRRKFYDLFYYTHHLFVLSIIFIILHWQPVVWWLLPTVVVYFGTRALSTAQTWTPVKVKELRALGEGLVKVVVHRSVRPDGQYKIGQFVYINVPSISRLQWHAFTISSSPKTDAGTFTVLLKALGDWTTDLVKLAEDCERRDVTPTVHIDGFYGASLETYEDYETICLVGGGIGATPLFAILEDIVAKHAVTSLRQRVCFIFSFRELALLEEVHPLLQRLHELDPLGELVRLHLFLTRTPSPEALERRIQQGPRYGYQNAPRPHEGTASKFKISLQPQSFLMPLQTSTMKLLMHVSVVVGATALSVYLAYGGGKIQRDGRGYLWMLQQLMDGVVLLSMGVVVLLVAVAEKVLKGRRRELLDGRELDAFAYRAVDAPASPGGVGSDVVTYQDLLRHYNVVVGARPEISSLMAQTLAQAAAGENESESKSGVVGVFVSGPEAMKRAVAYGALHAGAAHFDIHEEEFEL
ncbi:hypothetical protein P43SY_003178 [Pythium insidiosum]|uniref:FAD-binding FR-type domain-containing protein n=1 Tax=Pythium insidiosum TaxID=114742 RepID=A0AAD5LRK1_PYTIN|nr:hypothetical protein P43SY_003178 [Pythium insidiosum]